MADFLDATELSLLLGIPRRTLYNQKSSGSGPLAPILVKLGGRLGCWRADYDVWVQSQRKLSVPPTEHRSAA
jgi:predicted DNA-binding transcriptional regulator AlpA